MLHKATFVLSAGFYPINLKNILGIDSLLIFCYKLILQHKCNTIPSQLLLDFILKMSFKIFL